jgi:hypothetical protein
MIIQSWPVEMEAVAIILALPSEKFLAFTVGGTTPFD